MKLYARLFFLSSSVAAATASLEQPASDKHARIRELQPQSCAKGYSSFVGSGVVPIKSLNADLEYSAHVCFDESTGVALGEFFDSPPHNEASHVTYHVHCAARGSKGGIFFGAEIDYMSESVQRALSSDNLLDASETEEERELKAKKNKASKKPKQDKSKKSKKSPDLPECSCETCPDHLNCTGNKPLCCTCNGRELQENLEVQIQHANGEAKKKREQGESPQGTLAIIYFGNTSSGKEEFGLRLFTNYDHSCKSFASQVKDIDMNADIGPFVSGDFSIAGPMMN